MAKSGIGAFALVILMASMAMLAAGPACASEVIVASFASRTLNRNWVYDVYLPTGYHRGTRRYPVIYLLHGNADTASSWVTKAGIDTIADQMIARGKMRPCILVMPTGGRSWYIDGPEKMETAFMGDLLPEIDRLYRTRPDRDGRMIAGLSMGGYGAMRLALRYPHQFSAMVLMSPAIYVPEPPPLSSARTAPAFQAGGSFDGERWRRMNYPGLIDAFAQAHLRLRVQLTAGLQDAFNTGHAAEAFFAAWRDHGWPAELRLMPGAHDYALWRSTLPLALHFLAGPQQQTEAEARVAELRPRRASSATSTSVAAR